MLGISGNDNEDPMEAVHEIEEMGIIEITEESEVRNDEKATFPGYYSMAVHLD